MVRNLFAVVLAAVLLFVWGFVFWVVSPLSFLMYQALPNETPVVAALEGQDMPAGHYVYPGMKEAAPADAKKAEEEWAEKHRKGPIFIVVYKPQGGEPMQPAVLGMGFGHNLVASAVAAWLLWLVSPALPTFASRWCFVCLLGVFVCVAIHPTNAIWFWHTPLHTGLLCVFDTVGWVLAGLPLAALVKTRTA